MRVPAADAKHVFIIREAFDGSGFQTAAGQQELRLAMKQRDGYQVLVHDSAKFNNSSAAGLRAIRRSPWAGNIPLAAAKTAPESPGPRCGRWDHRDGQRPLH